MHPDLPRQVDTALRAAERAALTMDAAQITQTADALERCVETLLQSKPDAETLTVVREGVERYQRLCQFAGGTLKDALLAACDERSEESPTYRGSGQVADGRARSLIRTVG